MSAFAVFATVLTIGYIIYYGFTISRDIIASKKAEKNEPTAVSETGDGFSIAPKQIEELPQPDEQSTIEITPAYENNEMADSVEEPTSCKADELVDKTKEEMEPMVEASEPGFTPEEMASMIHSAISSASKESSAPKILCNVVDDTHGQEVPEIPDDNPDENADENAQPNDSQEEIRL